ncbi:MAG: hypothetical protein ABF436_10465 [Acetobacter okinawensis]
MIFDTHRQVPVCLWTAPGLRHVRAGRGPGGKKRLLGMGRGGLHGH